MIKNLGKFESISLNNVFEKVKLMLCSEMKKPKG